MGPLNLRCVVRRGGDFFTGIVVILQFGVDARSCHPHIHSELGINLLSTLFLSALKASLSSLAQSAAVWIQATASSPHPRIN